MRLKILTGALVIAIIFTFLTLFLSPRYTKGIWIKNAVTAKGVDEKLKPVEITNTFPSGTANVYCWFEWGNAKPNVSIMAAWNYVTDDVHILDYTFDIPRKSGSGSVSLSMPAGKELPAGAYRVDLKKYKSVLWSLTFKVLEKGPVAKLPPSANGPKVSTEAISQQSQKP